MLRAKYLALVAAALCATTLVLAEDVPKMLADFEALKDGDAVAPGAGADSTPWRRFGEATADNIMATADKSAVLDGKVSATYPLVWPAKFGAAVMVAAEPLDLSGYKSATIKMKTDHAGSVTKVKLQISDGKSTFLSKAAQPLATEAAVLSFDLSASAMEIVDGPPATFAKVLAGVKQIGFKVESDGSKYSENVIFDDLAVSN